MVPRSLAFPIFLMATALFASAQSQSQQQQQPPPDKPADGPKTLPNSTGSLGSGAPIDPKTYVIGPEDVLSIGVFHEAELSRSESVRPDGKITMPLIGDLQAEGLTPDRLRIQLKQALSTYINNPDVTITVMAVNSKRYTIAGQVMRPGPVALVLPTKVFDALSSVGFRDFANTKKIVIIRGTKRIKFNYNEVLHGKHLDTNILLEPGDTIYVP
ncbi:MAG TPA: polysaccharide biosynthesis/export family protein [Bryobacteraceae bacterium]|nr:polysaccharide biosynthesis/export family protein [Bryobacteraceae bacterium]